MSLHVVQATAAFAQWHELLTLLRTAFAYMDGRIDPPSSVHRLTPESLAAKAREEALFLAVDGDELAGCLFAAVRKDALHLSKLAVKPDLQRSGVGRRLIAAAERYARELDLRYLELDTRIELVENHAAFGALGFVKVAERMHAGYTRPTSVRMRKDLEGAPLPSTDSREGKLAET